MVLRIEADAQRGEDSRALALAATFLSAYAAHPQARHVQGIVDRIHAKSNP
jgi:hypothetical protein